MKVFTHVLFPLKGKKYIDFNTFDKFYTLLTYVYITLGSRVDGKR